MEKKTPLIQGLQEYFNTTPKEQLEKDLNELESYNEYGPIIREVLTPHPTIGIAECGSQYSKFNSIDGWKMKHYYVYKDGYCLNDYDNFTEASTNVVAEEPQYQNGSLQKFLLNKLKEIEDRLDKLETEIKG